MEDMTISIAFVVTVVAFVLPAPALRGFTDVLHTEMRMRCDLFAGIPKSFFDRYENSLSGSALGRLSLSLAVDADATGREAVG
jgi:hypothetical protein